MFRFEGGRPGDERGFIHKKILGVIGDIGGSLPVVGGVISTASRLLRGQQKRQGIDAKFGNGAELLTTSAIRSNGRAGNGECPRGSRPDYRTGRCELGAGQELGEPVMGMHGAGTAPGIMAIERAVCGRKQVLGDDGVCYHKTQISNSKRMWPRGRRPLVTGGEMRAVAIASRAGARLDKATTRLRGMGLMRALPKPRKAKEPVHHHHPAA